MSRPEDAAPRPHPAVESVYLPPDGVLYDERTGQVYRLNPSAAAVWMLLDGSADIDALAAEISDVFDVPVHDVRPDVQTALDMFARQGLLGTASGEWLPGEDRLRLPDRLRFESVRGPLPDELAVRLMVLTRGGQAVLLHPSGTEPLDHGLLLQRGIAEVAAEWAFVSADGASVAVGDQRWPLRGVLVATEAAGDVDAARGLLWPLARGDRATWERLLDVEGWVSAVRSDVERAVEAVLE